MTASRVTREASIRWYFCSDIPAGDCCTSCHEDADEYDMWLIQIDEDDGVIVEICCDVANWLNDHKPGREVADGSP